MRKFCLKYGASLVFASSNSNSNIDLTYQYVLARLYDQNFIHPSNTADKEALFIPTGFDSPELIEQTTDFKAFLAQVQKQMAQNNQEMMNEEPQFTDVIKKPLPK